MVATGGCAATTIGDVTIVGWNADPWYAARYCLGNAERHIRKLREREIWEAIIAPVVPVVYCEAMNKWMEELKNGPVETPDSE